MCILTFSVPLHHQYHCCHQKHLINTGINTCIIISRPYSVPFVSMFMFVKHTQCIYTKYMLFYTKIPQHTRLFFFGLIYLPNKFIYSFGFSDLQKPSRVCFICKCRPKSYYGQCSPMLQWSSIVYDQVFCVRKQR